jgi:GH25 family lysozyme M1 (1,4-beta-N-acetylmuramidase)
MLLKQQFIMPKPEVYVWPIIDWSHHKGSSDFKKVRQSALAYSGNIHAKVHENMLVDVTALNFAWNSNK